MVRFPLAPGGYTSSTVFFSFNPSSFLSLQMNHLRSLRPRRSARVDVYLPERFWKELNMEDFPLWLKLIVWTVVAGTVVWMLAAMIHFGLLG